MPLRSPKPAQHKHPFVFAAATCSTGIASGVSVHLFKGAVWAADDPVVLEHSHDGLFVDEPPPDMICRSTPDPARLEEAAGLSAFAAEITEADRNAPTSTLVAY